MRNARVRRKLGRIWDLPVNVSTELALILGKAVQYVTERIRLQMVCKAATAVSVLSSMGD